MKNVYIQGYVVALGLLVCAPAEVNALTPPLTEGKHVLSGLYNAYSPDVFAHKNIERMVFGGWQKESDIGADVIYTAELKNGLAKKVKQVFRYKGYHANDPSVVVNPKNPKELLMFFTALKDENATAENMMKKNWTGVARSKDGGKTWKSPQIIIGDNNGLDTRGAWSPSALAVGNEIWLYYHTNQPGTPDIYRTRLDAATLKILRTEMVTNQGQKMSGINVDVTYFQGMYHMLLGSSLQDNFYYTSSDGLTWQLSPVTQTLLKAQSGSSAITPTWYIENGVLSMYFSGGPAVSGAQYRYDSVYKVSDVLKKGQVQYSH